jgi:HEAT repeat protein
MRRFSLAVLALSFALVVGCGKKNAEPDTGPVVPPDDPDTIARLQLLGALTGTRGDARRAAIDAAAARAATDPTMRVQLVAQLRDKSNDGPGKTHPIQITSTREAVVVALLKVGPDGEATLREKGFPILREGLKDPDPAVREHTARAIARLGPLGRPLSAEVQKLIVDPDSKVRGAAADAVRDVGVTDVPGLAALLGNTDPDVRRYAGELLAGLAEIPAEAIEPLIKVLDESDEGTRVAAANTLALAGPTAGPAAAEKLAGAIRQKYPSEYDPTVPWIEGPELAYWQALIRIGEPAVPSLVGLLGHGNPLVQLYAATCLGEIGPPAKAAAPALLKLMTKAKYADVQIEAACALCRIGEHTDEAAGLIQQALDEPKLVRYALGVIPRMGPAGKRLVKVALAKLSEDDPNVRVAAVLMVGQLEPDDAATAVPKLAQLVGDPEPAIRLRVGMVLEKLGPAAAPAAAAIADWLPTETNVLAKEQYVEALIAMGPGAKPAAGVLVKTHDDADLSPGTRLRVLAAAAAADPANPAVAAAAIKAAGEKNEYVRAAAASALGRLDPLSPEALATLTKMAKSDSMTGPRMAAVRALAVAGVRARAARADLEALAGSGSPGIALWAKVAIAAVDGDVQKAAGVVRAGLTDPNASVRLAAADALSLIGPTPTDLPALLVVLKDPAGREPAARAIGRLGPAAREAVPRLAELLGDNDTRVRVAAADALGQIGSPGALPAIPKLREALKDPAVEPAARRALEKLGVKETRGRG